MLLLLPLLLVELQLLRLLMWLQLLHLLLCLQLLPWLQLVLLRLLLWLQLRWLLLLIPLLLKLKLLLKLTLSALYMRFPAQRICTTFDAGFHLLEHGLGNVASEGKLGASIKQVSQMIVHNMAGEVSEGPSGVPMGVMSFWQRWSVETIRARDHALFSGVSILYCLLCLCLWLRLGIFVPARHRCLMVLSSLFVHQDIKLLHQLASIFMPTPSED